MADFKKNLFTLADIDKIEKFGKDNYYINPGSVSLPKENNPKTFAIYEKATLSIMDFDKNVIDSVTF